MENTDQILDAPEVQTDSLATAGFWIRTAAYILDAILLTIVNFILSAVLASFAPVAALILNTLIAVLYFALMESSENQATLGKMAVGIKVGDLRGNQITFANAIGRYFAKIISALPLGFGFMMVGWSDKNQGLHDKLADTLVFYK